MPKGVPLTVTEQVVQLVCTLVYDLSGLLPSIVLVTAVVWRMTANPHAWPADSMTWPLIRLPDSIICELYVYLRCVLDWLASTDFYVVKVAVCLVALAAVVCAAMDEASEHWGAFW